MSAATPRRVAVVTGAGAGVGRATTDELARQGFDVGLLSRDPGRLDAAADAVRRLGGRAVAIPTDVADSAAVDAAALRVERELGPIDVWINVAMATAFAPVSALTADEIERGTRVTYLGQVHGMLAALRHMRPRGRGTIVNVGSALAYRSVPLQSVYCGAKFAIRGFTDSLRSELIHDGLDITLTMVELPAVNTPQFDWSLNKTGKRAKPVAPIYQPELIARAIHRAATTRRREYWVGWPTVRAVVGNWLAPGLVDRYLAKAGYDGQLTDEPLPSDARGNLFEPVPGPYGAHGRFDDQASTTNRWLVSDRERGLLLSLAFVTGAWLVGRAFRTAKRG